MSLKPQKTNQNAKNPPTKEFSSNKKIVRAASVTTQQLRSNFQPFYPLEEQGLLSKKVISSLATKQDFIIFH